MRPLWKDILTAVWLGIILPGIVLNAFVLKERHREAQTVQIAQEKPVQQSVRFIPLKDPDGTTTYMDLEAYLTGVLLAEIPASFHEEALKAQSAAARTYAWKAYTTGGKHGGGCLCMDSSCCQAYIGEEAYLSRGGTQDNLEKVRRAVQATSPMVLSYEGELIEATYFSSTGGSTEAAVAVWGADFPYLQAVSSPEKVLTETVIFDRSHLETLLNRPLAGDPEEWFTGMTHTDGGGVKKLEIGGETYTGVQLRSLLGLRSTSFQVHTDGQTVAFTTQGYGHRVGMSQYGANAMAEAGSTWQEILQHYYPGTTLHPIS